MHFGIFVEEMRQGATQAAAFRDIFETGRPRGGLGHRLRLARRDPLHAGRARSSPPRSRSASAIASRTRRLRVGTAVQVLPLNHPLRIAEEVATVDHISEGRFEFGIGRSGVVRTYDVYGVRLRREPGALPRGARDHPRGRGRASRSATTGEFYRVRQRDGRAPALPGAASADPHGRDQRRDVPGSPAAWACRSSSGCATTEIPDLQAQLGAVPRGLARGRPSRRAERLPAHPGLRLAHARRRDGGAAREPDWPSSRARPSWRAPAVGRAGAGPADRRQMQAERMASALLRRHAGPQGGVRHRRRRRRSADASCARSSSSTASWPS